MTDTPNGEFTILPIPHVDIYSAVLRQLTLFVESLAAGDRLPPERELAERFAVSRMSLREALRSLESMGRIEIRRNSGSYVLDPHANPMTTHLRRAAPLAPENLSELVQARAAVEDRVVTLLDDVRDFSPIRARLRETERELADAGGEGGSVDVRFEAALAKLAGNRLLIEMQRSLHELWVEAWGSRGHAPGDANTLHAEHVAILAALEAGDGALARRLMEHHVDRGIPATH